ncbi:MAG: hypothetical protein Fur0032_00570 [Terrimicrobiaceae bacterium]
MPKIAKKILIACGGAAALVAVVLLAVNLYLQSDGVQSRIRDAASKALGAPVEVAKSHFTPWGGFVVGGISIPDPAHPDDELLSAKALRFRFAFLPLLTGRLVINEVRLEEPLLIARQSEDKHWAVLVPPPPSRDIPVTLPADGVAAGPAKGGKSFQVTVRSIRVKDAKILFIDRLGRTLLRVEGAEASAKLGDDQTTTGFFKLPTVTIMYSLKPRGLRGTFTWNGEALDIPDIEGMLGGGRLTGSYRLDTKPKTNFRAALALDDAKLRKLAEEAGVLPDGTAGTLKAAAEVQGDPADAESLTGGGTLDLFEGRFRPVDFLVQVGTMFGIQELQMLELSEATSKFTVKEGRVVVDNLLLRSENLVLSGQGNIEFGGGLDIDAALKVNKKLQKQLGAVLSDGFKKTDDPEYRRLDFSVTNTLANPRTDLLDKLVGAKIGQDVGGLIRNLFGPPKKKKPKQEEKAGRDQAAETKPGGQN